MGYLDNSSITVDAILTKRGRELLARNDGSFNITQFALGDDEIDYTLFNENHPNGSQFSGEAIENMPLLEAFPDENNIMIHKLITLPRGTSKLPIISANVSKITLTIGSTFTLAPTTLNLNGTYGIAGGNHVTLSGLGINNATANAVTSVSASSSAGSIVVQTSQSSDLLTVGGILRFDGCHQTINIIGSIKITKYPTANRTIYLDVDKFITVGTAS